MCSIGKNHFLWLLNPTNIKYIDFNNKQSYSNQMTSSSRSNISKDEKQLLDEWINQIEELKNELQILKKEQQCEIILSNAISKLNKIHTGLHLWRYKNIKENGNQSNYQLDIKNQEVPKLKRVYVYRMQ